MQVPPLCMLRLCIYCVLYTEECSLFLSSTLFSVHLCKTFLSILSLVVCNPADDGVVVCILHNSVVFMLRFAVGGVLREHEGAEHTALELYSGGVSVHLNCLGSVYEKSPISICSVLNPEC